MEIENVYNQGLKQWDAALSGAQDIFADMNRPEVGDLVFESTAGRLIGSDHIGFLIAIDYNSGWPQYWIVNCKDKKVIKWENCKFIKILGHKLYQYKEYLAVEKENNKK